MDPLRIGVTGYAEYRPVASNSTDSGRAQNRRVEVLILPTTVRGTGGAITSTPKAAQPKVNKDTSATIDARSSRLMFRYDSGTSRFSATVRSSSR